MTENDEAAAVEKIRDAIAIMTRIGQDPNYRPVLALEDGRPAANKAGFLRFTPPMFSAIGAGALGNLISGGYPDNLAFRLALPIMRILRTRKGPTICHRRLR